MRIFIAFKVPNHIAEELVSAQKELEGLVPHLPARFAERENFHVTVEFLGELSEYQVRQVKDALAVFAPKTPAAPVWIDRLDAFPSATDAHVVVARVSEEHRRLALLHDQLQAAFRELDLPDPKRHEWQPHITIARLSHSTDCAQAMLQVTLHKLIWNVEEVLLMESLPAAHASHYRVIETYPLGKSP